MSDEISENENPSQGSLTDRRIEELETAIGYRFKDRTLLVSALTHPSHAQQNSNSSSKSKRTENNQRLEFLGDAVLSMILAEELYFQFEKEREGVLSRNRSALVKGEQLADLAWELNLNDYILLGEGEMQMAGRRRDSILGDALEAVVGAIFLDSDFKTSKKTVLTWYGNLRKRLARKLTFHNRKGQLQELIQPDLGNEAIEYEVASTTGPDHDKSFNIKVYIQGELQGEGTGTSKKEAEENAAGDALSRRDAKKADSDSHP